MVGYKISYDREGETILFQYIKKFWNIYFSKRQVKTIKFGLILE